MAKVFFPPFFKKREAKLNKQLLKLLQESADSEPVFTDEHGEYRIGIFLHRNCIVDVRHDDDLWTLQIVCDQPVSLMTMKEIRYKFVPDAVFMAHLFAPREITSLQKSVMLYEIPDSALAEDTTKEPEV